MDSVTVFLLAVAGVLLIGTFGDILARRTGIPDAVWLIGAGIVIGPVLGIVGHEQLDPLAPYLVPLILVAVLFESGVRLKLTGPSTVAVQSGMFAAAGFVATVFAVASASMLAASVGILPAVWTWTHGFLAGAILGGPSSVIVIPALASSPLDVGPALGQARTTQRVTDLVNRESAIADVLSVVVVLVLIDILIAEGRGPVGEGMARRLGLGLAIGAVVGFVWIMFLKMLHSSVYAYPVTLAVLLILAVSIERAGGSAALGVLAVAVVLGNAPAITKGLKITEGLSLGDDMRGYSSQLAFVIKSFFFTYMGAQIALGTELGGLQEMPITGWGVAGLGVLLAAVILASRWLAVGTIAAAYDDLTPANRRILSVCVPRGMMAGGLAALAASRNIPAGEWFPPLVFSAVLASVVVFAIALPMARRRPGLAGAAPATVPVWRPTFPAPTFPSSPPDPTEPNAVFPADKDVKPGDGFRW